MDMQSFVTAALCLSTLLLAFVSDAAPELSAHRRELLGKVGVHGQHNAFVPSSPKSAEALFKAIVRQDLETIDELLFCCPQFLEAKDNYTINAPVDGTPLHTATWLGRILIVRTLLDAGGDIEARSADGSTPLHVAVQGGKVQIVQDLIKAGANLDVKDEEGWTPLHLSSVAGNAFLTQILVDAGADPEVATEGGVTPLMVVAATNRHGIVAILLNAGADVENQDMNGNTALHIAAMYGGYLSIKSLKEGGANSTVVNNDDLMPANVSCSCSDDLFHCPPLDDCDKLLIESLLNMTHYPRGAELFGAIQTDNRTVVDEILDCCVSTVKAQSFANGPPVGGGTLLSAVFFNRKVIFKKLLAAGAPVNFPSTRGFTALHVAAQKGSLSFTKLLVEAGADVDVRDKFSYTPMWDAVGSGKVRVVKYLLRFSEDPAAADRRGQTSLMLAASQSMVAILRLLLDAGVDVNGADKVGETALHEAAMFGAVDSAEVLIENGADPLVVEGALRTPFDVACKCRAFSGKFGCDEGLCSSADGGVLVLKAFSVLNNSTAPQSKDRSLELRMAIAREDLTTIEDILECCPESVEIARRMFIGPRSASALHFAAWMGSRKVVAKLLEVVPDPDVGGDFTPLVWAAIRGHTGVAEELLDAGARVNASTDESWTPLHYASLNGHKRTVGVLLENGADAQAMTEGHLETPLIMAASLNDAVDVVQILLDTGVDIDHQDLQGETALHEAAAYGAVESTKLLLRRGANAQLRDTEGRTPADMVCQCQTYAAGGPFALCAPAACTVDDKKSIIAIFEEHASSQGD